MVWVFSGSCIRRERKVKKNVNRFNYFDSIGDLILVTSSELRILDAMIN